MQVATDVGATRISPEMDMADFFKRCQVVLPNCKILTAEALHFEYGIPVEDIKHDVVSCKHGEEMLQGLRNASKQDAEEAGPSDASPAKRPSFTQRLAAAAAAEASDFAAANTAAPPLLQQPPALRPTPVRATHAGRRRATAAAPATTHNIYKIVCVGNGLVYIGQTVDPPARWQRHSQPSTCPRRMRKDVQQYQPFSEHFVGTILHSTTDEREAARLERDEIAQHGSTNPARGYNILAGHPVSDRRYWVLQKCGKGSFSRVRL